MKFKIVILKGLKDNIVAEPRITGKKNKAKKRLLIYFSNI